MEGALEKVTTKRLWLADGLPTPRYVLLKQGHFSAADVAAVPTELGLPLIVKPAREGSSLGLTKVTQATDMAEAVARKADVVITQGATQSNHARQTAAAAVRLGMRCHILLEDRTGNTDTSYTDNGNVLLDRLHGATVEHRPGGANMQAEMEALAARLADAGHRPYVIPGGGSTPLGALGYANAALELVSQAADRGLHIDHLVHATGSAGTQAGLVAGLCALNSSMRLLGIGVRAPREKQETMVYDLACRTWDFLGLRGELPRARADAQALIRDLDERIKAIDEFLRSPYRNSIIGAIEGRIPKILQTPARADAQALYDSIKDNTTLTRLLSDRSQTETGASPLGIVSDRDVDMVARGATRLTQIGTERKQEIEMMRLRDLMYETRQLAAETYNNTYREVLPETPELRLEVPWIAPTYEDKPKTKTPTRRAAPQQG
jgi:hypothetical protein